MLALIRYEPRISHITESLLSVSNCISFSATPKCPEYNFNDYILIPLLYRGTEYGYRFECD